MSDSPSSAAPRPAAFVAQAAPQGQRPVAGILWMLLTGALFVGVTAVVKHVGSGLPAAESAFLRYALGLVFLLPALHSMSVAAPDRRTLGLLAVRGSVHAFGVLLWFYAMTRIPLADVTALNYVSPVYITLGSALFLGERLAFRRLAAIAVALAGAMIILRPGLREVSDGHLAMLGTGLFFAASYLIAKALSDRMSPATVVAWLSLVVTAILAPFAWAVWVPPTWEQIAWMFLVAALATAGHYTMTLAFRAAPMAATQPVTFLQLVWAVLLGTLVFGEALDLWVVVGGTLIMAAVSFITWREAILKRRAVTPPAVATKL